LCDVELAIPHSDSSLDLALSAAGLSGIFGEAWVSSWKSRGQQGAG